MKEEIYNFLKERATKYRIISGFSAHNINDMLYLGKENVEKIFSLLNELARENDEIEIYHQTGPTDEFSRIKFVYNKKRNS